MAAHSARTARPRATHRCGNECGRRRRSVSCSSRGISPKARYVGMEVGRNLQIDYRWEAFDPERAKVAVGELLRLSPDVIIANSVSATQAAKQATQTVPIIFTVVSEPISLGFVASLSHPGGNVTGFTTLEPSIATRWLELLKEIAPGIARAAFMFNPDSTRVSALFYKSIEVAAAKLLVEPAMLMVNKA